MTIYTCDSFSSIKYGTETASGIIVETAKDAAEVFANRYARRIFGRRGYCHLVRADSWAMDGSYVKFEAFVGIPAEGGGTSGHNAWFTVYVQGGSALGDLQKSIRAAQNTQ